MRIELLFIFSIIQYKLPSYYVLHRYFFEYFRNIINLNYFGHLDKYNNSKILVSNLILVGIKLVKSI